MCVSEFHFSIGGILGVFGVGSFIPVYFFFKETSLKKTSWGREEVWSTKNWGTIGDLGASKNRDNNLNTGSIFSYFLLMLLLKSLYLSLSLHVCGTPPPPVKAGLSLQPHSLLIHTSTKTTNTKIFYSYLSIYLINEYFFLLILLNPLLVTPFLRFLPLLFTILYLSPSS